ncbi:50S ribosomal protein L11 methyltransferase [Lentilitoribacter sp. Alg239-R112]|uniref:50S ribosomal protein L11 methyltransferase n=1 Tax=Lentilitoribacter sp. Alg239-R112 TaxID=2305987 RepID=UPI0013A6BAE6|nr:50S ribosomal protein L11 methyltransferase [Lentilitoribacter sp. Alg239-R112]
MTQTRLYVTTDEKTSDFLSDLFEVTFEEDGFASSTTEIDEVNKIWEASVYVNPEDVQTTIERLNEIFAQNSLTLDISHEVLPDIDWVTHTLKGLKPVTSGRFIVHGSHDRNSVQPHHIPVEINAAQAFGTGHHGTTAGCLEMIEHVSKTSHTKLRSTAPILDLGTGSGVLAIAAAKLARTYVLATDIDPIATKIAEENAVLNKAANYIEFATVNGFASKVFNERGPFGLIIANILARPLMKMAPKIAKNLQTGGTVILSGILAEQRWKVLSAFNNQGLYHQKTIWRNGWVTIVLK